MNFLESILLGFLQGLTEFLPVSSSGHLVLAQHFFGVASDEGTLFEVFLHLGTLFAVLLFFRKRIWELIISMFTWKFSLQTQAHRHNHTLVLYLIISSVVTAVFYIIFKDFVEAIYQQPLTVAFMLIVTGAVVFVSDYIKTSDIPSSQMGIVRSTIIGLVQGIAIIPGISRSGSTIAISLITGIKRREAAEFSFLLSIPAILGANLVSIGKFSELHLHDLGIYLAGFISAFIVGYLVIAFLIELISQAKLKYFSIYCWVVAAIAITLILLGV